MGELGLKENLLEDLTRLLPLWLQFPLVLSIVCEALTCLGFQFLRTCPSGCLPTDTILDLEGLLWYSSNLGLTSS